MWETTRDLFITILVWVVIIWGISLMSPKNKPIPATSEATKSVQYPDAHILCVDGTYSSSVGRGTCSHHGGEAR